MPKAKMTTTQRCLGHGLAGFVPVGFDSETTGLRPTDQLLEAVGTNTAVLMGKEVSTIECIFAWNPPCDFWPVTT